MCNVLPGISGWLCSLLTCDIVSVRVCNVLAGVSGWVYSVLTDVSGWVCSVLTDVSGQCVGWHFRLVV